MSGNSGNSGSQDNPMRLYPTGSAEAREEYRQRCEQYRREEAARRERARQERQEEERRQYRIWCQEQREREAAQAAQMKNQYNPYGNK